MVRTTSDKQILRTFQRSFKDRLQFFKVKIYLINWDSLTLFDKKNDWVWPAIACEVQKIAFEKKRNRNEILFMHKNVLTLLVSFTGSYTKDETNTYGPNHPPNVSFNLILVIFNIIQLNLC